MPEQGATYTFEDLSGSAQTPTDDPNPYNALIDTCQNDSVRAISFSLQQQCVYDSTHQCKECC